MRAPLKLLVKRRQDTRVTGQRSLKPGGEPVPDVFISYSRRDKAFVERLNQGLAGRGKDAWVDWEDIPASAEWMREIQDGIDACDAFLYVLTPESASSHECARELAHALERRKRIVPIVHRDVDPAAVPPEAAAINWVYLREQDSFEHGLETLVEALDTDLDHVRVHTRLASQAINWDRAGRDRARLIRGSELQDAERWLTEAAAKEPGPTEVQAQFVQASRDAARRRGRMLFGGVAVALVVAVVLAIVALIQRSDAIHQSQIAYSRQLDADALSNFKTDPELSLLLSRVAAQVAPGASTEDALLRALAQSHVRERYTNSKGPVGDALWSPNGDRLLIADEDANRAEIVQPGTRAKPIILPAVGLREQIGWDANGGLAMTGGAETQVWNGLTGKLVRRLPTRSVQAALSPDGRRVATTDHSGVLHVWSVATGAQLLSAVPATIGAPGCVHWSPDGSMLAVCNVGVPASRLNGTGNLPETLTVFSSTGKRLLVLHEPQLILDLAFSPDSRRIALAVGAGLNGVGTEVYDIGTRARVFAVRGSASAVAFNPQGNELAYAEIQGDIAYVYTFGSHKPPVPLVGNTGTIQSLAFSHTGTYVATGGGDGTAQIFNSYFGTQLELLAGDSDEITDATFSPDDSLLATASKDGTARVWTTPVPHAAAQRRLASFQQYASVSPSGNLALVAGPASPTALVLDPDTLAMRATLAPPAGQVFGAGAFSPDGRWITTLSGRIKGSGKNAAFHSVGLEVYDARTARRSATIAPAGTEVRDAVFDRNGDLAALYADGEVDLFSAATGRRERVLLPAGSPADTVSFSSDGSKLAVSHPDGSIDLLTAGGTRLHKLVGPRPIPLIEGIPTSVPLVRTAFSPDGSWLAATGGGDGGVELFSVDTGRLVRTFKAGSEPFISLAISPHGNLLAAGNGATAYLWRLPSGPLLQTLVQADPSTFGAPAELSGIGGVRVAFSADGSTLLTSGDLTARVWNAQSGDLLLTVPFAVGGAITPDAQRLVVDSSGLLGSFNCDLCGGLRQLLSSAARDVTRGFTPSERARYLRSS